MEEWLSISSTEYASWQYKSVTCRPQRVLFVFVSKVRNMMSIELGFVIHEFGERLDSTKAFEVQFATQNNSVHSAQECQAHSLLINIMLLPASL